MKYSFINFPTISITGYICVRFINNSLISEICQIFSEKRISSRLNVWRKLLNEWRKREQRRCIIVQKSRRDCHASAATTENPGDVARNKPLTLCTSLPKPLPPLSRSLARSLANRASSPLLQALYELSSLPRLSILNPQPHLVCRRATIVTRVITKRPRRH